MYYHGPGPDGSASIYINKAYNNTRIERVSERMDKWKQIKNLTCLKEEENNKKCNKYCVIDFRKYFLNKQWSHKYTIM